MPYLAIYLSQIHGSSRAIPESASIAIMLSTLGWLCSLNYLVILQSRKSFAQLTGSIVSPGNPYTLIINITNPTANTISILKWNNIFDNETQLPVSFHITDDQGNEAHIASTYAMRSGITDNDLYKFAPGQTFSRTLDVRSYLHKLPSGPSGIYQKAFQVSLPPVFQGVSHSGDYSVPAEAAADLNSQMPTLGNYTAAGLGDITLAAQTAKRNSRFPIYMDLDASYANPAIGIRMDTTECVAQNATAMADALFDAGTYAHSAATAANDPNSKLYTQFFPEASREAVQAIMNNAVKSIHGSSAYVALYCTDLLQLCGPSSNILGYTFTPSFLGDAYIVLCPSAMSLGRAPAPCWVPAGTHISSSASHVMFHLVLTLNNVVGPVISNNVCGVLGCKNLASSSGAAPSQIDATKNSDSYAQLAIAQWGFGLGGDPYNGPSCLPANGIVPAVQKRHAKPINGFGHFPRSNAAAELALRERDHVWEQSIALSRKCSGDTLVLLQDAAANARALAKVAQENIHSDYWGEAFNGGLSVKQLVNATFDVVRNWNTTGNDGGVRLRCDFRRRTFFCKGGTKAFLVMTDANYLIFCPSFFYQPLSLPCQVPTLRNPTIDEQGGEFLHLLIQINNLVGRVIHDGHHSDPRWKWGACYNGLV